MKTKFTIPIIVMAISSMLFAAPDHNERKRKIQEHESRSPSEEALTRRSKSESFLTAKQVRINKHLPVIGDSKTAKLRTPTELAERLLACTICAVGGETGDSALVQSILRDFEAQQFLSPKEKEFLDRGIKNQQQRIQFSWRYERSWVLLWALGYVGHLEYPPAICDVPKLVGLIRGKSAAQIVREANPRSLSEILDEADLIYRLNWAVVDARVNGTAGVPKDVEKGVVLERHAALNWIIGYMDQEWDDVTTDT